MTNLPPPSEAQYNYIAGLLAALPAAVTGINDVPAAIAALRANPAFGKREASAMIEQLLGLKAQAAAAAVVSGAPAPKRGNAHPGKCHTCKATVAAGDGWIERSGSGKWLVFHNACPTPAAAPAPAVEVEPGLYVDPSGPEVETWRVYIGRQSGRRQAAKLIAYDDHGVFEYVKGGTTDVDRRVAVGTLRPITAAEAHAFGSLHDWCVNCGLAIEDDRSKAAGYGPVCATNNGWFYPNHQQAANILRRPVTRPSGVVVEPEATSTAPEADDAAQGNVERLTWTCAHGREQDYSTNVEHCDCPRCPDCGAVIEDVEGEPCLQGTPDYRGQYPTHTL